MTGVSSELPPAGPAAGTSPDLPNKGAPRGEAERVTTIDGLRGLAAMLVVLFHLHGAISRTATDWLWSPIDWIARNGFLGVDIFFVISGFVIALSVSKGAPTFGYFGRFVVRRSIRLDPPYWTSILLELLLLHLTLRLFSSIAVTLPSVPQMVAHLFYAQELLGYGSLMPNYWTLCYEIQFYAFFVGLVVLRAKLPSRLSGSQMVAIGAALFYLLSLYTRFWKPEWLPHGLAIDRWFQFFIGALTWRAVTFPGKMRALALAWITLAVAIVVTSSPLIQFLPIAVSAWLVACSRDARWGSIFTTRPFKFLGLISYSIYLYHGSVGWRFVSLVQQKIIPGQWSSLTAVTVYIVGIIGAVAFSWVLWYLIERPCLKLCQRVKLPKRAESPAMKAALA